MISIIIPVYNTSKYLDQCLKSVLKQTYTDWECIVVDDGSADNSGEICDKWAEKDGRFIIIHQKNQGVSAARNHGIQKSKGEYICFIDSDDWVEPDYLSNMINTSYYKCSDLIVTGTKHVHNNFSKEFAPSEIAIAELSSKYTDIFIKNIGLMYGPCSKLYYASIIKENNILFPEHLSFGEDTTFVFRYLEKINSILYINTTAYNYRIVDSNSLSSKYRDDKSIIRYELWLTRYHFYELKNMWNDISQRNMYRELWAIIYDGIFSVKKPSFSYLNNLLNIKEIDDLNSWKDIFNAPYWIKYGILKRLNLLFYVIRKFN